MKTIWITIISIIIFGIISFIIFSFGICIGLVIDFPENITMGYDKETLKLLEYNYYSENDKLSSRIDSQYLQDNYELIGAYWGINARKDNIFEVVIFPTNHNLSHLIVDTIKLSCFNNTIYEVLN